MRTNKSSITVATLAGLAAQAVLASQQDEARGFLADSHLTLNLRHYYYNYDKKNGVADARDWAQGALLDYKSGFTRGTLGFGLDAFAYGVLKLDGYGSGVGNLTVDNDGDTHSFSHVGGALKVRLSNTVLKYGIVQPVAPVFAAGGSRILPQTAQGFLLQSEELRGLALQGGHFTAATGWRGNSNSDRIMAAYAGVEVDSVDYLGGDYAITDNLSVALYAANYENVWRQYYGSGAYTFHLAENQSLRLSGNLYRTLDQGRARAGRIDTSAWSLAAAYAFGSHKLTLGYQQIDGDEPFDYVGFGSEASVGDSIYLANSVQISDFNGPGEKSVQLRYDLDMSGYGVPGLSFMARHIHGRAVDGSHADPGGAYAGVYGVGDSEQETDVEAKYVVQSGPAKDLMVRLRQAWHRGDTGGLGGGKDQFRIVVQYPLSLF